MRVSVDTDAAGAAELVAAIARINIRDALRCPALRQSLLHRCQHRPDLLRYGDDATISPFKTDEWASWAVVAERFGAVVRDKRSGLWLPGNPEAVVVDDCEGLTAAHAAALVLLEVPFDVWVAITHPENSGTAHAYIRLRRVGFKGATDTSVFDPSVLGGMQRPREGWYDQPETKLVQIGPMRTGRYV